MSYTQNSAEQDKNKLIAQIPLPPAIPRIDIKDFPAVEHTTQVWTDKYTLDSFELPPPSLTKLDPLTKPLVYPINLTHDRVEYEKHLWYQYDQAVESILHPPKTPNKNQFWAQQPPPQLNHAQSPQSSVPPEQMKSALNQLINQKKQIPSYQIGIPPQTPIPSHQDVPPKHLAPIPQVPLSDLEQQDQHKRNKYLQIKQEIAVCQKCPRCAKREYPLIGHGHLNQPIMFVDSHPTELAMLTGQFLMENDVNLTFAKTLNAISLHRDHVYLTSLLKCGAESPKFNEQSNHWLQCLDYFWNEVDLIKPKLIIALGQLAHEIIFPEKNSFPKHRGQKRSIVHPKTTERFDYTTLLHPRTLLQASAEDKTSTWQHLKIIALNYQLPIKKG